MIQLFEVKIVITTKRKKRELLHDKGGGGELCNYNKKKGFELWIIIPLGKISEGSLEFINMLQISQK